MPDTLKIDRAHSSVGFSAKHFVITTVRGEFKDFDGIVEVDGTDHSTLRADVTIKTASISTNSDQRDDHLRSADFFDSENYPDMRFKSTGVEKKGDNDFLLRGDLTIKDVTRPVELEARLEGSMNDPYGNERTGVSLRGEIDREDWGLTWNQVLEAGAVMVSKKVKLEVDVAVLRPLAVSA
ncbi:MAG: YceI family protein [Candidatus Dormibacteria bacterium]